MYIFEKFAWFSIMIVCMFSCSPVANHCVVGEYLVEEAYVAKFKNDVPFAVSLVFDDNDIAHFEKIYPILKKWNLVATFNVSPGYQDFESTYKEGYSNLKNIGCEIGAHGWYHLDLTTLNPNDVELHMCKKPIELIQRYFNTTPVSISLNNAQTNKQIDDLFRKYFFVSKHASLTNVDRSGIPILSSTTFDDVKNKLDDAKQTKKWCIIALHGVDGSGWSNGSIESSLFEKICELLVEKKILVDTSGEIGLYEYLYENTQLQLKKSVNLVEIVPVLPNGFIYPENWNKQITIIVPKLNNEKEVITFDFRKNSKIVISELGINIL